MILVIIAAAIILAALGFWLKDKSKYEDAGFVICFIGVAIFVVALFVSAFLLVSVSNENAIDNKIVMYQQENTKIEQYIADTVEQYQQYEKEIITEVTPETAIAFATFYPELKSDTLVKKQIDIYITNNEKIKNLMERKINISTSRWWLCFGG